MRALVVVALLFLSGCIEPLPPQAPPETTRRAPGPVTEATLSRVSAIVIPVAERHCRALAAGMNCNFQVGVDRNPKAPPNAFQTVDENGRPQLIFNTALLADLRNVHELAFILAHEAAHHIEGHLGQTNRNATTGAILGGVLAAALGADAAVVDTATRAGAVVGSRTYSKEFELEADALGARIAKIAGYDPVVGAEYFTRIADPGNRFLGTHPPNADRINTVRRAAAGV